MPGNDDPRAGTRGQASVIEKGLQRGRYGVRCAVPNSSMICRTVGRRVPGAAAAIRFSIEALIASMTVCVFFCMI